MLFFQEQRTTKFNRFFKKSIKKCREENWRINKTTEWKNEIINREYWN